MPALENDVRYNVYCGNCGQVFTPQIRSPLWWKAKKRAEKGYLDAHQCTGEECGCIEPCYKPDALFRVFGYNDLCEDFDIPCDTFTDAVRRFKKLVRAGGYVVFIDGVSSSVREKIEFGF